MKKGIIKATLVILILVLTALKPAPSLAVINSHSIDLERDNAQYLSIADVNQTGLDPAGDWSVSFWINLESQPPTNTTYELISKINAGSGYRVYYDNVAGQKNLEAAFSDAGGDTVFRVNSVVLNAATWHHIVIRVDASLPDIDIFIDNVDQGAVSVLTGATTVGNNSSPFRVGEIASGTSRPFDGLIDEIYFFDDFLATAEVDDMFNQDGSYCSFTTTDPNLQGGWSLNNVLTDSSGNGNTLMINNSAVFSTTTPFASDNCNPPIDGINALISTAQGFSFEKGIEQSLLGKLNAAKSAIEKGKNKTAANILGSFINFVEAQKDKKIGATEADSLIDDAEALIQILGF